MNLSFHLSDSITKYPGRTSRKATISLKTRSLEDAGSNSENDMEVQRYTASGSPTLRKRTAVTSVPSPREEEISGSFANEGYDSDDDADHTPPTALVRYTNAVGPCTRGLTVRPRHSLSSQRSMTRQPLR